MSKFVVTDFGTLGNALCEACGIDPCYVRRIVLDLEVGNAGKLYFETFADSEVLSVSLADLNIEVKAAENGD